MPLAASSAARRDEHSAAHKKMFGPRRGYDAIGEPSVSNADKPRVQPVKVDPKAIKRRPGMWCRDCRSPSRAAAMRRASRRRRRSSSRTSARSWPGCTWRSCWGAWPSGIIGFSTKSGLSPLPGLVLLPVAICFVVHALGPILRSGSPSAGGSRGPYEDKNGPVALAIVLSLAACSNILIPLWWCRRVDGVAQCAVAATRHSSCILSRRRRRLRSHGVPHLA